jgi:DNA transformation protein
MVEMLEDELRSLGPVQARRMFGGFGLFAGDLMFALISDDVLYFKVDDELRPRFEAEGLEAFAYDRSGGRRVIMSYWRAPERLLDDADELREWARAALAAARRGQRGKSPAPRKPRPPAAKRRKKE